MDKEIQIQIMIQQQIIDQLKLKRWKTYELVPAGSYTVGEVDAEGHLKSSDPTIGKVAEKDKNITYIYKLKEKPKGNVYVHYKDTEGNELKSFCN